MPGPPKASPLRKRVLGRYSQLPWGTRLFLWLRWVWTPYGEMGSLLPAAGRILDGGCGHGLFALTLAFQSPLRKIEGIDHSPSRVAAAQKAARGLGQLAFKKGDFRRIGGKKYDGLVFMDVLHYIPHRAQVKLLEDSHRRLRRGGILLFRDVDRRPGFASSWNRFHEVLMTALGFTKAGELHFRSAAEWKSLARSAGFRVESHPAGRFPFADVLFLCQKF